METFIKPYAIIFNPNNSDMNFTKHIYINETTLLKALNQCFKENGKSITILSIKEL
jgi:hypothetical protein